MLLYKLGERVHSFNGISIDKGSSSLGEGTTEREGQYGLMVFSGRGDPVRGEGHNEGCMVFKRGTVASNE